MRKLLGILAAAGVMAGMGMAVATPAEAHGCCTYAKKVYYRTPVDHVVKKVSYVRVRSYRTVYVKRLYQNSLRMPPLLSQRCLLEAGRHGCAEGFLRDRPLLPHGRRDQAFPPRLLLPSLVVVSLA